MTLDTDPSASIPDYANIAQASILKSFSNDRKDIANSMECPHSKENVTIKISVLSSDFTCFGVQCLIHDNHDF